MSTFLQCLLGGSAGAALVAGLFTLIKTWMDQRHSTKEHQIVRKEKKEDDENIQDKALRFLMLYIIQERAKEILVRGYVTVEERRSLYEWHNLYHVGLSGNGDADTLMQAVDSLPLRVE